jgi:hypothetical protein
LFGRTLLAALSIACPLASPLLAASACRLCSPLHVNNTAGIFEVFESLLLHRAATNDDAKAVEAGRLQASIAELSSLDLLLCRYWRPVRQKAKPETKNSNDAQADGGEGSAAASAAADVESLGDVGSPDSAVAMEAKTALLQEAEAGVAEEWRSSVFILAAYTGELTLLAKCIDACGPLLVQHTFGSSELTALMAAAAGGQAAACSTLIEAGASVTAVDAFKRSAVFLACSSSHIELVRFLVQAGGSIRAPRDSGETAADELVKSGNGGLIPELELLANLHCMESMGKVLHEPLPMDVEGASRDEGEAKLAAAEAGVDEKGDTSDDGTGDGNGNGTGDEALMARFQLDREILIDDYASDDMGDDYAEPEPDDLWEEEEEEEEEQGDGGQGAEQHGGSSDEDY